jgi:hypothetical protein
LQELDEESRSPTSQDEGKQGARRNNNAAGAAENSILRKEDSEARGSMNAIIEFAERRAPRSRSRKRTRSGAHSKSSQGARDLRNVDFDETAAEEVFGAGRQLREQRGPCDTSVRGVALARIVRPTSDEARERHPRNSIVEYDAWSYRFRSFVGESRRRRGGDSKTPDLRENAGEDSRSPRRRWKSGGRSGRYGVNRVENAPLCRRENRTIRRVPEQSGGLQKSERRILRDRPRGP